MPTHVTHIGPLGPVVSVGINVSTSHAMLGLGGAPRSFTALIDTGASTTAISPIVRQQLQLQVTG